MAWAERQLLFTDVWLLCSPSNGTSHTALPCRGYAAGSHFPSCALQFSASEEPDRELVIQLPHSLPWTSSFLSPGWALNSRNFVLFCVCFVPCIFCVFFVVVLLYLSHCILLYIFLYIYCIFIVYFSVYLLYIYCIKKMYITSYVIGTTYYYVLRTTYYYVLRTTYYYVLRSKCYNVLRTTYYYVLRNTFYYVLLRTTYYVLLRTAF